MCRGGQGKESQTPAKVTAMGVNMIAPGNYSRKAADPAPQVQLPTRTKTAMAACGLP